MSNKVFFKMKVIIAVRMKNDAATLEDSLAVSYKLNILLPYDPAISLLGIYPKELEMYWVGQKVHLGFSIRSYGKTQMNILAFWPTPICPHENVHKDIYSNITHSCQNLKATKM